MSFVHLHVHTTYSLLDGFSSIPKLIARVKEMGMPAIAITDHGTMFGTMEFYNEAVDAGVKPLIGLETYMAARSMTDRDSKMDKHSSHMLLLVENETGYHNLLEIASQSQLNGFYYFPRIDHDFLAKHAAGLIATSGCMSAEIPRAITNEGLDAARRKLDWYYDVFGANNFFLELQEHNVKELPAINKALIEMGPRYEARYVATNDTHYINKEDARLQDILLAIQTGSVVSEPNRLRMSDDSYYLRSPQEMSTLFAEVPEALSNTLLIAERCNVDLGFKGYHLPQFPMPEGYTAESYLRELCETGLVKRYGDHADDAAVRQRLNYELGIIHRMGFDAYFLIIWDLCRHAREQGIWYNVRGSGPGSIVAYSLEITVLEPIEYGLIFERFLNPGRVSMPDIDLDFPDDKRAHMMDYCARKYGYDKVAQIITFGTMGARAALRDVGRVLDIPLGEVDRIAKLIPNIPGKPVTIAEALKDVTEFQAVYNEPDKPFIKELIDTASKMEGTVRSAGTHAAGVVITDRPIIEYAPLHRPTSGAADSPIKTVTQFEMSIVEKLGLLKVDFLGLVTLTVMTRACEFIKQRHGVVYNLTNIPNDDPETFEFIGKGHTAGVFQLEGTGMTRYITQMHPKSLANVIAMVALYRPGPMEFIPKYIKRMHGEEPVTFPHPALKPIFEETYGIPIYQEQIMFAAMELAGYDPTDADDLRKAISKKMKDKLLKHREKFIKGAAAKKGIPEEAAAKIFADWEEFARYGFNKAHAADYGLIAVQTGFLKAHYTVEYMTALLSASKNETEKVALYVADSRSMGVAVLPPDVNASEYDFSIEDLPDKTAAIRFGLGAVKNVGQAPVDLILASRRERPFDNLNDFARRVDLRPVGKRALESLVKVGALDRFGPRTAQLDALDRIISISSSHFRAAESGQLSLFGAAAGIEEEITLPPNASIDKHTQLNWERELIGLYITDHPLQPYMEQLQNKVTHYSGQLADAADKDTVVVAGLVSRFRPYQTKSGKEMGFVTIEDIQGFIELVLFPTAWKQFNGIVDVDAVISVEGKVDAGMGDPKVLVDRVYLEKPLVHSDGSQKPKTENAPEKAAPRPAPPAPVKKSILPPAPQTPSPLSGRNMPQHVAEMSSNWDDGELPPPPNFDDDWSPTPPPDASSGYESWKASTSELTVPAVELPPTAAVERGAQVPGVETSVLQPEPPTPAAASQVDVVAILPPAEILDTLPVGNVPVPSSFILGLVPKETASNQSDEEPRMVIITINSSGDKIRDVRRLRRIHGMLVSCPGKDHFTFHVHENNRFFLLDFPNESIGLSSDLLGKLITLVGENNVRVETIRLH